MKLSLSWIFDHIDADWKRQDIPRLVAMFNEITAEIERFYPVRIDLASFALGKITKVKGDAVHLAVPEWSKEVSLSIRDDIASLDPEQYETHFFLIKKDAKEIRWVSCIDFQLEKVGYLPAVSVLPKELDSAWKERFECEDIILEVDNKSITHRPDMWGHRGFAREIAAILDVSFLPKDQFLHQKKVIYAKGSVRPTKTNPFTIENRVQHACTKFAGLYFSSIDNKPSPIFILSRLVKVGSRPINAIVDLTNYLLQDWSQPVHAFDAEKVIDKHIIVRVAKKGEKLTLLDEQIVELTSEDLVVCDPKKPMALAGVMGGLPDSVDSETTSIFLESAHFDAAHIRRTAQRHKVRTESSARFEKTLDPNQPPEAIMRFIKLADQFDIRFQAAEEILCVGEPFSEQTITVSHEFLQQRGGVELTQTDVVEPLSKLGFQVKCQKNVYGITIPSFRGAKDVKIAEDILEEVLRFYGFNRIERVLPTFAQKPFAISQLLTVRKIKAYLSSAASMTEQQNYGVYDQEILSLLHWDPGKDAVEIANPISERFTCLATSLVPHLFKNIVDNYHYADRLYFFELGRKWHIAGSEIAEQESLAGIFFHKHGAVDFYDCKYYLDELFALLGIEASWKKIKKPSLPWFNFYQTAKIVAGKKTIGIAGKVDRHTLRKLDVLPDSEAFIFELDLDFLLAYKLPIPSYKPMVKYQESWFDLSFIVPLTLTCEEIEQKLRKADKLISSVALIDFFEQEAWTDKRALAFRITAGSAEKTLQKEEIEQIMSYAIAVVEKLGATLRA